LGEVNKQPWFRIFYFKQADYALLADGLCKLQRSLMHPVYIIKLDYFSRAIFN